MHRDPIISLLKEYGRRFPNHLITEKFWSFVSTNKNCFDRNFPSGHITASAWIVDPTHQSTLLVHHKKLGLWLQPGGHCDGETDVAEVARKEVKEETGLKQFTIFADKIFDLDIHLIPKWKNVPEHLHYDVRFLIHADSQLPIEVSEESHAVQWFQLKNVFTISTDESVTRMVNKALFDSHTDLQCNIGSRKKSEKAG